MKLEIDEKGKNTLVLGKNEEELCVICKEKKKQMYFCESNKRIYCLLCLVAGHSRGDHTDYLIHKIKVENE